MVIESSYCSWRLKKRGKGPEKETGRKEAKGRESKRGGVVGVVLDGGKRAMAGKEDGRREEEEGG